MSKERRGLEICTFGKVIRQGWDWLGLTPSAPNLIGSCVKAPALAACLTLNKGNFVRVGSYGAIYLAYRRVLQEAVLAQLSVGDGCEPAEEVRRREVRPVERDLERVLVDLAEDFPLLASLVERWAGGQKRLPIGRGGEIRDSPWPLAATAAPSAEQAIAVGTRSSGKARISRSQRVNRVQWKSRLNRRLGITSRSRWRWRWPRWPSRRPRNTTSSPRSWHAGAKR